MSRRLWIQPSTFLVKPISRSGRPTIVATGTTCWLRKLGKLRFNNQGSSVVPGMPRGIARQSSNMVKGPMVKLRALQLMPVSRPRRLRAQSSQAGQRKSLLRPAPRMMSSVHSTCLEAS